MNGKKKELRGKEQTRMLQVPKTLPQSFIREGVNGGEVRLGQIPQFGGKIRRSGTDVYICVCTVTTTILGA